MLECMNRKKYKKKNMKVDAGKRFICIFFYIGTITLSSMDCFCKVEEL